MRISIESALMCDVEVISKINTDAFNDENNRFGPGVDGGPPGYNEVGMVKCLLSKFPCYKIIVGKSVIGWFWLHEHDTNTVELEDFCISPQYHNMGYGYETLLKMHMLAPEKKRWILGTPHYSLKNQHLYEKAGYIKTGLSNDEFIFRYEKIIKSYEQCFEELIHTEKPKP